MRDGIVDISRDICSGVLERDKKGVLFCTTRLLYMAFQHAFPIIVTFASVRRDAMRRDAMRRDVT